MTDREGVPVLAEKRLTRRIGAGSMSSDYEGPNLHMVVPRMPRPTMGDQHLLDRLSNETMIAIGKGLGPLGSVKRR